MTRIWRGIVGLILCCICQSVAAGNGTAQTLECHVELLREAGWHVSNSLSDLATESTPAVCESFVAPRFYYQSATTDGSAMVRTLERIERALYSTENRCLFSRRFGRSVRKAVYKLIDNKSFAFPSGNGREQRDPFEPPDNSSWIASGVRGYDIPQHNLHSAIESLYSRPAIAECAAAKQIAQTAALHEFYHELEPNLLTPQETPVGVWRHYVKSPPMVARQALLVHSSIKNRALAELAGLGQYAFNGQMGYMRAVRDRSHIDSYNNLGQNFLITAITTEAVQALRTRHRPLNELNKIASDVWQRYSNKLQNGGEKKTLRRLMQRDLLAADPFFRDANIYVHPLGVKTFAYHLARQFFYNPRTPYKIEIYEDYLSGYFFNRYVERKINQCRQRAWCRRIDRKTWQLINADGSASPDLFDNQQQCSVELAQHSG